jgi:RNA polymerase sigma-70 factor (ECF subfamily)
LPEPILDDEPYAAESASEYARDLSATLLLALERLSPLERAAFLLHDVFDVGFSELARSLDRSEAACRQLAARARDHVRRARPRFPVSGEEGSRIAGAFLEAARTGDTGGLASLLVKDAVLHADGGGKRSSALRPISGNETIARFFVGLAKKGRTMGDFEFQPARIGGQPGYIIIEPDGFAYTIAFDVRDGLITAIYVVRNPDKLAGLAPPD